MNTRPIHILLIDDDEIDIKLIKRALLTQKILNPVHVASNGIEGLAMLRGEAGHEKIPSPALILLDLNMPKMDGLGFLKVLKSDQALLGTPVFVLITTPRDAERVSAYAGCVSGFILKSQPGQDFVEALKQNPGITLKIPLSS